jgi:hydroxymethylpyrimidine pyrophosphatase-like HAD family hydrolase
MSHDFKLILTDIDGTILPYGQPCINERCRSAMHAALDAGICIGPASGRGHRWIDPSLPTMRISMQQHLPPTVCRSC